MPILFGSSDVLPASPLVVHATSSIMANKCRLLYISHLYSQRSDCVSPISVCTSLSPMKSGLFTSVAHERWATNRLLIKRGHSRPSETIHAQSLFLFSEVMVHTLIVYTTAKQACQFRTTRNWFAEWMSSELCLCNFLNKWHKFTFEKCSEVPTLFHCPFHAGHVW